MSKPTAEEEEHSHTRGRFALASAIYVIGVVAYCAWSYGQYRYATSHHGEPTDSMLHEQAIRTIAGGFFLLAAAFFPMLSLYRHAQAMAARATARHNRKLQQDMERQKQREAQLKDAMRDLERFNAMAVGRENRIIELKGEVNTLLEQMNQKKRYNIDKVD